MQATLNLSYGQVLALVGQLPLRSQLRLGKALTERSIKAEMEGFIDAFRTDEISECDILDECKAVRRERYARRKTESHC